MINLTKYLQGLLNINPEDIIDTLNILNSKFLITIDNEILNLIKTNVFASLKTFVTIALNSTSALLQWLIHFRIYSFCYYSFYLYYNINLFLYKKNGIS